MGFNNQRILLFGGYLFGPIFLIGASWSLLRSHSASKSSKIFLSKSLRQRTWSWWFFFLGGLVDDDGPLSKVEPNRYLKPPGGLGENCGFSNVFFYRRNLKGEMEHQRMATKKFWRIWHHSLKEKHTRHPRPRTWCQYVSLVGGRKKQENMRK